MAAYLPYPAPPSIVSTVPDVYPRHRARQKCHRIGGLSRRGSATFEAPVNRALPKSNKALLTLYASLMEEVKLRIHCVDRAVNGQTGFPGPIVREFCYGQLRLLCELIALSCLVAHGDIPATYSKQLGKKWSADEIFGGLSKLRKHFYPIPVRQESQSPFGTVHRHEIVGVDPMPLPKDTLLDLYGKCHSHLHRGNVRKGTEFRYSHRGQH